MLPRAPRRGIAGVAVLLLVSLLTIVEAPASPAPLASAPAAAATADPVFRSSSGGSRIIVGGVVRSELTGSSALRTKRPGRMSENATANVNLLNGLLKATAVSTRQRTTRSLLGGGTTISSQAKIAGVNLLGGAITVDAIETTATATFNDGEVKRTGGTRFVNLKVRDNDLPINIPKNFAITIPGLAKVVLNDVRGQVGGDALIKSFATSIRITLLSDYGKLNKGAVIEVTPTQARVVLPVPIDGEPIFGVAYSTRTRITVGDAVKLNAGPTSAMIMPAGGTNGVELTNGTAKIDLPGLVRAFVLSGSATGTVTSAESRGTMTGKVGDVSLLGGVIAVDAITAKARVRHVDGARTRISASSQLVGLTINGKTFPINVEPNTVVRIPGLVKVIINEQIRRKFPQNGIAVRALHVIALPDAPKDIVGLDLEVGVAAIWVNR